MTKLENLECLAYEQDIHIHDYSFSEDKKACCYHDTDKGWDYKAILLDRPQIKSNIEETLLLAEELGHFVTDSLYLIKSIANTKAERSNRLKYENKAKKWALREVLPPDKIKSCWSRGIYELHEISEELDYLPYDFILKAIDHYRATNELPQLWESYES